MSGIVGVRRFARVAVALGALLAAGLALAPAASSSIGTGLPPNFADTVVASGLNAPTAVQFAPDGHVFIAEKSGIIKVLDSVADPTPTVFADLSASVHDFWDRGLLGLAVDPQWPARPYVYVLYSYDYSVYAPGPSHSWGDTCPTPPGPTYDGCVIGGRLSRLTAVPSTTSVSGFAPSPAETVLITDWCQQFPSHSVGSLVFGADGSLYASAGEGAHFYGPGDYGQYGGNKLDNATPPKAVVPANPCGDPVGPTASGAEGGAFRAQDVRTAGDPAHDPTGLDGSIIRVDPDTGTARPTNPGFGNPDPNVARIIAYGLRNPFRMTRRPGAAGELWFGDVGWNTYEEINRLAARATGPVVQNFGWPCFEGATAQPLYAAYNNSLCAGLTPPAVTSPFFSYDHTAPVVSGESCLDSSHGSSTTGLAFYDGTRGNYPTSYDGALFFADQARQCIWVMTRGPSGDPDPATKVVFHSAPGNVVDLETGPGGDLYYVDMAVGVLNGGSVHRIRFSPGNQPPTAVAMATPAYGPLPMTVSFDGTRSSDPDVESLTYSWDLDGDGAFGDAQTPNPSWTYSTRARVTVGLMVTDHLGSSAVTTVVVYPGNAPPVPSIPSPNTPASAWTPGELISYAGSATDDVTDQVSLSWQLILHHCPVVNSCHQHLVQTMTGSSGSFNVPDPDNPSYLELRLTATDPEGMSATTSLSSTAVPLTFTTDPPGLQLTAAGATGTTSTKLLIVGSLSTVSTPSPQVLNGVTYTFASWSDGGAQTHSIVAPSAATTYTALFTAPQPAPPVPPAPPAVTPTPAVTVPVGPAAGPTPSPVPDPVPDPAPIAPAPQADTTAPAPAFAMSAVTTFDSAGKPTTEARWSVPFGTDGTSIARIARGSTAPQTLTQGLPVASIVPGARPLTGATGTLTTATLPALASGTTYALSVFQVDLAGNVSAPVSRLLVVPKIAGPARPLSALRLRPVAVRWRLTGRTGAPLARTRVAILVRTKGSTRWRSYRRVVTDTAGFAEVRTTISADTEFALRYNGDASRTGVQSRPVIVKLRAR